MRFGMIRFWAHRFLRGECIPFFDRATNRAIDAHVDRILRTRTRNAR
jgi:hypothetical protein